MNHFENVIVLCGGPTCRKSDTDLRSAFEREVKDLALDSKTKIYTGGCQGKCEKGPIVLVYPDYTVYGGVKLSDVREIVESHVKNGKPVERLALSTDHLYNRSAKTFGDVEFFGKQLRIALRNCGVIDPESLDEYLSVRGYEGLAKVLTDGSPQGVIDELKKSGLRGRGGAGFPTGLKWEFVRKAVGDEKYVICNADEGDPGAFMDRSAIEGDPHSIIEGMAISGYAVGSSVGIVYIRAEYPLAVSRLHTALEQAREAGFLGKNILGSDFSFDIQVRLGAGAFVCGEETALIHSLEGHRGMPSMKPPFPANSGFMGKPTLINNVETFANIPSIIVDGADWFSKLGTEKSKGTKVFALAGNVKNTGLIEVPMGTTIREIVYSIGGGIPGGKKFKAAQTGGPSGGCLPEKYLDTGVDYESLAAAGSIMGSGGFIILDEDTCMVNLARFFLEFTKDESCGKCLPCREGTRKMLEILTRITQGKGELKDLDELKQLAEVVKNTSLCGLGQSAPNPVLSTLEHFRDEYVAHVVDKKCPTKTCTSLLTYNIEDNCIGCGACKRACPTGAITGSPKNKHIIDQDKCIKCGACMTACKFDAITLS